MLRTGRRPFRRGWRRHVVDGVAAIERTLRAAAPTASKRHLVSRFLRTPWRSRSASRAVDSASLATGVALVRALAAFDAETAEHSATVALYARDVALHLGADGDSAAVHPAGRARRTTSASSRCRSACCSRPIRWTTTSGRSCASTPRPARASSRACPRATRCSRSCAITTSAWTAAATLRACAAQISPPRRASWAPATPMPR